jgi:VIT1/CCC1 family predicted Fe2+/Mn2+ transporter
MGDRGAMRFVAAGVAGLVGPAVPRHPAAPVLATLLVVKMVTLGLALLFMVGFVYADTGSADVGEAVIWATITVVSAAWLAWIFRRTQVPAAAWLRPTVWP